MGEREEIRRGNFLNQEGVCEFIDFDVGTWC